MNSEIKVLIIDDDADFVKALKLLLSKDNCRIFMAYDGIEGLRQVQAIKPDLVLLDVVLPGMNGKEVCRQIKNNPENAGTLVILMSGYKTSSIDQAEGLESGADGFIAKTMSNREMKARLSAFIRMKRLENALVKSETRYKMLFNTMIIGYAIHEIVLDDGGKPIDYRFLEVNPEFEKLTGLKASEIKGRRVLEILPTTEPFWIETYGNVVLTKIERRFVSFSAAFNKYFEVYVFPTGENQFATLFYDVTERIMSEERIKNINTALQKLNNDKDKFFSIIAHDLKSPFNLLIGYSELLLSEVGKQNINEIKKFAEIINLSANQTFRLLENLLEWAMLEMGKIPFQPKHLNLYDQVNEVFGFLLEQAVKKKISLVSKIPPDLYIFADIGMTQTILRNLISNAIKFSYNNSEVIVDAQQTENGIDIIVIDQGIGIKKADITKLLTTGTNFSTTGTNKEKGTGLGLMLCKEFIGKHNGKLIIESKYGHGSKFIVKLEKH